MKDKLTFNTEYRRAKKDKIFQNLNTDNTLVLQETNYTLNDELKKIQTQYTSDKQKDILKDFEYAINSAKKQLDKLRNKEKSLEYEVLNDLNTLKKEMRYAIYINLLDRIINNLKNKLYMNACNTCYTLYDVIAKNELSSSLNDSKEKIYMILDKINIIYIRYEKLIKALYNDFLITFSDALYFHEIKDIFSFELRYGLRTNPQQTLKELSTWIEQIDGQLLVTKVNELVSHKR